MPSSSQTAGDYKVAQSNSTPNSVSTENNNNNKQVKSIEIQVTPEKLKEGGGTDGIIAVKEQGRDQGVEGNLVGRKRRRKRSEKNNNSNPSASMSGQANPNWTYP
jgi:hypothetical protein